MRTLLLAALVGAGAIASALAWFNEPQASRTDHPDTSSQPMAVANGVKAFDTIYEALMHPRCMNCHPSGDAPLQGDASTPHLMNVTRGRDDAGAIGMRCTTCHQQVPVEGKGMPPGVEGVDWHLAPLEQAFEGKSKRELAAMLADPERSHMDGEELIAHIRDDALVGWGWNPGEGRTPVPVSRDELVAAFQTWVDAGMPLPEAESK